MNPDKCVRCYMEETFSEDILKKIDVTKTPHECDISVEKRECDHFPMVWGDCPNCRTCDECGFVGTHSNNCIKTE